MSMRRNAVSVAALLVSQIYLAGLAAAQQTPPPDATQPAATPAVGDAQPVPDVQPDATGAPRRRAGGEDIVVTGSRIRRKDLTTPAPVTVINREQVTASGKVSIGDFLQQLPEQGNAINTTVNNGGDGATRVNLRGLGDARTLVLLNGRRMVPGGAGADASADLNSIPTSVIERVEILKDGASAIYGSDAIGGVVNIITRRNYNGAEAAAFLGTSGHGDATIYDFSATVGNSGDRGNITFGAGFYKQKAAFNGDRDWAFQSLFYDARGTGGRQIGEYPNDSNTIPNGRWLTAGAAGPGNALYTAVLSRPSPGNGYIRDPNFPVNTPEAWRPYVPSFALGPNGPTTGDGYNFSPINYLVTPQQRISLYGAGDTRFGNIARGFFETSFVNRTSQQKLASEPLVTPNIGDNGLQVDRNNIYNPFNKDLFVLKRLNEFGQRVSTQNIDTFRILGGLDGTLSEVTGPLSGWFWEVAGSYGRSEATRTNQGNLFTVPLANALGPSFRDPANNNQPTCGTPANPIGGCVPLNLFGGANSITQDMVNGGLIFTGISRGVNQLNTFGVNTSGELFKLFADRPVGLALGYEFRRVYGLFNPDPIVAAGLGTGNAQTITQGSYYSNEGYGELSVPIVSNLPGADILEATAALRVFNYSNFGSDLTYKFGGRWRIIRDITVRGTYSTAFRAPNIAELYLGQSDNFPNVSDPCAQLAALPIDNPLVVRCMAQGVPRNGTQDPSTQLRSRVGGNPGLQPETAKIFTVGLVLEPTFLRNFSITADYYNTKIEQSINTIGANVILAGCYPTDATPSKYCDLVRRDNNTHLITNITDTNQNVGKDSIDGIDLAVRYALPTDFGRFGFSWDGTWLHAFDRVLANGQTIHGRGTFDLQIVGAGTGAVFPAYKFNTGVTYAFQGFNAGVNMRFIGSFHECATPGGLYNGGGLCYVSAVFAREVKAYSTYNVYLAYTLGSAYGKTTLAVGVNNVLDIAPSKIYNGFTGTSDPTAYDFLGRFFYTRLSHAY